jgi:protein TonB
MRYRYLSFACLGLLAHPAWGQATDSVAVDSASYAVAPDERWVRSQTDSTGECTEVMHWSGAGGLVRVYHPSGHLKDYLPYTNLAAGQLHGVATSWYDDGQLAIRQTFLRGQRDGDLVAYYPDGKLKRQTQYTAGSEMLGQCFAPSGAPLPFFLYEQPPLYPGGQLQLIKEISRHARQWQPAGMLVLSQAQIHVRFQVGENGQVENPQITITDERFALLRAHSNINQSLQTALSDGLGPLVSRLQHGLTTLTKPFSPGKRDGATVRWQYSLTIPFTYSGGRF